MKNVGDLMQRLQKMMPAHIKPAFKTGEELLAWHCLLYTSPSPRDTR